MQRFINFYKPPVPLIFPAHRMNSLKYRNLRTSRLRLLAHLRQRERELRNRDLQAGHERVTKAVDEIRTFVVDNHDELIESIDDVVKELRGNQFLQQDGDGGGGGGGPPSGSPGGNNHNSNQQQQASGTQQPDAEKTVSITMADRPFEYRDNFRDEFVHTIYNSSLRSYSLGDFYWLLKKRVCDEDRYRRRFKATHPESPAISYELVTGQLQVLDLVTVYPTTDVTLTDVQCAICILWTVYSTVLHTTLDLNVTFDEVFAKVPLMLDLLESELKKDNGTNGLFGDYAYADAEDVTFYNPPKDARYPARTFDKNVLVRLLHRLRCIQNMPNDYVGAAASANLGTGWEEDRLYRVCRKLLQHVTDDVPPFVHKQYYLRCGCTCVAALLYVKCLIDSMSVFAAADRKFALSAFLPTAGTYVESDYRGRNIKNFAYIWKNYVTPVYKDRPEVSFSGLFPGAALFAISHAVANNWLGPGHSKKPHPGARTIKLQLLRNDPLYNYLATYYQVPRNPLEVLKAHDRALFYFEYGIYLLLNQPITFITHKNTLKRLFNVHDAYELCYFFVIGFIPLEFII
ncbi:DNA packaging protein 2 [Elephant endotheliotropic herpesvirus 3B]|nr:DNA packaging protein 2 [Elephant endotheliotropic herpesvirus 3B]